MGTAIDISHLHSIKDRFSFEGKKGFVTGAAGGIGRSTAAALAELGADHEDLIELAWNIGETVGQEVSEKDLARCATVGELWRFVRDLED